MDINPLLVGETNKQKKELCEPGGMLMGRESLSLYLLIFKLKLTLQGLLV